MKKTLSSVKKNFLYQCIYEVLIIILPFVTSPYIARVLGAEGIGIYSYTYTIANYFVLFANLGIKNYGNRIIAEVRDDREELNKTFSNLFSVMFLVSIIIFIVYMTYAFFFSDYQTIALIQCLYVLSSLIDINWFYFGIEKFKLTVIRNTIIKLGTVVSVFLFVRDKDDLWTYCLVMSLGTVIGQLAVWPFLKKYVSIEKPTWKEMILHIKPLLVLFVPVLAVSLYKYMDKIMLGMISTKPQVGFYENAEKAINIPVSIITSFGTVMLPRISNMTKDGNVERIKIYIGKSIELIMCMSFAMAFGMLGVARNFSVVFWGSEFETSGSIIMILAITIPFLAFANVIRTQFLIPLKLNKLYIISVFVGALVNLSTNMIFIYYFGAIGAAYGTVLAEVAVCIIQSFFVRKKLPVSEYLKKCLFFMIAGCVMFVIVYLLGFGERSGGMLIIQSLVGGMIYIILCLLYFKYNNNEWIMSMVCEILNKEVSHKRN